MPVGGWGNGHQPPTRIMKAIPTRYADTEFRSRLEARWAAFFDLVGWRWEYEPIDLPGWIPDFLLIGATKVLVEVKPADSISGYDLNKICRAMEAGNDDREVLLIGRAPNVAPSRCWGLPLLGWLIGNDGWHQGWQPHGAAWLYSDAGLDFCSDEHSFMGRLTLFYDGNAYTDVDRRRLELIEALWREAGNITRWNRPRVIR